METQITCDYYDYGPHVETYNKHMTTIFGPLSGNLYYKHMTTIFGPPRGKKP